MLPITPLSFSSNRRKSKAAGMNIVAITCTVRLRYPRGAFGIRVIDAATASATKLGR